MFRSIRLLLTGAGLVTSLSACESTREVVVRVTIPGLDSTETPMPGIGLVALPYDRDSVLRQLEARARTPRPNTAALDTLFGEFRKPFAAYSGAAYRVGALRDTLSALERRLDSVPRTDPEYRALYARFESAADSLRAAESRRDRARSALESARGEFVSRSDSLRAAVRHWEDSTYRGYDSIVRALVLAEGREPVTDTTDAGGWARLELRGRPWWIYARSFDAADPNSEWYWNVPVRGDTVLLSSKTGRRQPRY